MALEPRTVADFFTAVMSALDELGLEVRINERPNEIPEAIPFSQDHVHAAYDPHYARRFWQVLVRCAPVFEQFRTGFLGKSSPVHFFWGSFDLAHSRFSGRRASLHPGGIPNLPDSVVREAYSHELSSAGFWPGGGSFDEAAFYAYAYPEPTGYRSAKLDPEAAFFSETLGEFILPYSAVRSAPDPEQVLLGFLKSRYEVAALRGNWDRRALECSPGRVGVPRSVQAPP